MNNEIQPKVFKRLPSEKLSIYFHKENGVTTYIDYYGENQRDQLPGELEICNDYSYPADYFEYSESWFSYGYITIGTDFYLPVVKFDNGMSDEAGNYIRIYPIVKSHVSEAIRFAHNEASKLSEDEIEYQIELRIGCVKEELATNRKSFFKELRNPHSTNLNTMALVKKLLTSRTELFTELKQLRAR